MPVNLEIETNLVAWLLAQPAISTLVGSRIYPDGAPQREPKSYATFFRVSGNRWRDLSGVCWVGQARVQINCIGTNARDPKILAAVMIDKIDSFKRGVMGNAFIQCIYVEDTRDDSKLPIDASERMEFKRSFDVMITWEEIPEED